MKQHFGVIGYPVAHSLSPWIHRQFLQKEQMQGDYRKIPIAPENFSQDVSRLLSTGIDGFNVTVPFKQDIIPFLDELDSQAASIGAVNTVSKKNGRWIGYNTDGIGYVQSLESAFPHFFDTLDKSVLILGAGGAARGIYAALLQTGIPEIHIANRTRESAVNIAKLSTGYINTPIFSLVEAEKRIGDYDLIIQTTSVGMVPDSQGQLLSLDGLHQKTIVSDIVYKPLMTKMLKQANQAGVRTHCGHHMLLHQARFAFEIWTGHKVDISNMDQQLEAILEGR